MRVRYMMLDTKTGICQTLLYNPSAFPWFFNKCIQFFFCLTFINCMHKDYLACIWYLL